MLEAIPSNFYIAAAPFFIISLASLVTVLFPSFNGKNQTPLYIFTLLTLLGAFFALASHTVRDSFWNGAFVVDNLSLLSQGLIVGTGLILTILFKETSLSDRFFTCESVSLFLLTMLGMMVMVSSSELVTLFVGLELSSIGIYVLVGYVYPNRSSLEGAMKYLVLGSFASAFLLFGFALMYAASGTMNLSELGQKLELSNSIWVQLGALFTLVGLGFKLALVPFHMWAPDAYEAAPTGITALMATSVKVMILVLALRLSQGIGLYSDQWFPVLFILASLSMIVGNVLALVQSSLKRMLAYSSIAHSGYMAIVLCAMGGSSELAYQAIIFYLIAYTLTTILAFGTLMWLEDTTRQNLQLSDLRGLVKKHPWAAFSLSAAMFSFSGMPPTVGFFAKFFVFNAALRESMYVLVLMGVVGSVISLYYYLRVIVTMYMQKATDSDFSLFPRRSIPTSLILGGTCLAIFVFGTLLPEQVLVSLKPIAENLVQP